MQFAKKDGLYLPVNVEIDVWDAKNGKLLDVVQTHNLAVLDGRNLLRNFLNRDAVTGLNYFAIGMGTTSPAPLDHTLQTEVFRDIFTSTTESDGNLNVKYYLASGSANGNTLTEAALFGNGATATINSGTLYARVTFTGIPKTSSIAITFSWDCGFTV